MSTQYTIADLRTRLFEAIDGVKANTMTIDQARTIGALSQVIVNTAKVEIDLAIQDERKFVPFLAAAEVIDARPALPPLPANGITSITRHVLEG